MRICCLITRRPWSDLYLTLAADIVSKRSRFLKALEEGTYRKRVRTCQDGRSLRHGTPTFYVMAIGTNGPHMIYDAPAAALTGCLKKSIFRR